MFTPIWFIARNKESQVIEAKDYSSIDSTNFCKYRFLIHCIEIEGKLIIFESSYMIFRLSLFLFQDCGEGKKKAEIYSDATTSRGKRDLQRIKRDDDKSSQGYYDI